MKLLLLAGTREARELSFSLKGVDLISSLAGATQRPAELGGAVRIGGFGGIEGLKDFVAQSGITHVVDATHPFAAQMSRHAFLACNALDIPLLQIIRPPWDVATNWTLAEDMKGAADLLKPASRTFLATGRGSLEYFRSRNDVWFLARVIDDMPGPFPMQNGRFLVSKPPFSVEQEIKTLQDNEIDTLVVRNSGGVGGYEKVEAANRLGLTIVMVKRPETPDANRVESSEAAIQFMKQQRWLAE